MAIAKTKTEKTKYADMIFPDEKSVKNDEKLEAVEEAVLDVDTTIAAARKEVRTARKTVELARRTVPFSSTRLLSAIYHLENKEADLEVLEKIKEDLF
jgi:hypothetical protein